MDWDTLISLLMQKPGYEIVEQLLGGPQRRKELRKATETEGGTLENWLSDALDHGLIERNVSLRNEEKYVEYKLAVEIPPDLLDEIHYRGRMPREKNDDYADTAGVSHFVDKYKYR